MTSETNTTSTDRVRAIRERRHQLGLARLELYAHPDDHNAIKFLAARLQRRRVRELARVAVQ